MERSPLQTMVSGSTSISEAQVLGDRLLQMPDITRGTPGLNVGWSTKAPAVDKLPIIAQVRAILRARRSRDRFFDASLFADPAWDMLLELYLAELLGERRLSVGSLCQSA